MGVTLNERIVTEQQQAAQYANDRLATADELLYVRIVEAAIVPPEKRTSVRNEIYGLIGVALLIVSAIILWAGLS